MTGYILAAILLPAMPCESLQALTLPSTTITTAVMMPTGPLSSQPGALPPPPGVQTASAPPNGALGYYPNERPLIVAAHCRVVAVIRPTPDSEIGMELWLPANQWNGKFQMVGNGGWAGRPLTPFGALNQGYATAWTDTGHTGASGAFALGHPEKVVDFAYRAVHETAIKSKAIIAAYYGQMPALSYFNGCSTGGRQGLMAAQRFPEDFDGIIAAAPAQNMTGVATWRFSAEVSVRKDVVCTVPAAKLAMVNRAVLTGCDALDGVADQILNDPRQCRFDPSTLLCQGDDSDSCLTACQVAALKMAYAPITTRNGVTIFPGLVPGGESRWSMFAAAGPEPGMANDLDLFRFFVHQDADWDWRAFDAQRDSALASERVGFLNATNPDLSAFKARGGKLILYHGWNDGGNDGAISPLTSIDYYESVLRSMGPAQSDWFRLFMVPGMAHCLGGPAPDQVNWMGALERWREAGIAPDRLTAARVNITFQVDMTRPVCAYPQSPKYTGIGSTNDAANFVCQTP